MVPSPYRDSILVSMRRIIRAIDVHSHELGSRFQLTGPQLVCLRQIARGGPCTPGELALGVYVSQSTVTGILNRLESRGLIRRERIDRDRRRVTVSLTPKGSDILKKAPPPLQQRFSEQLDSLSPEEQKLIDQVLARVANMMDIQDRNTSPAVSPSGPVDGRGEG